MIGSIAGDIIGSVYERQPIKHSDFPLFSPASTFTDDTVMTVAVAYAIIEGVDYLTAIKQYARAYPNAGYGGYFYQWMMSDENEPYNSWGNGSAMRASPVGFAFDTMEEVLAEAEKCAAVSHNHPEGIKGAQATAAAVFLARLGKEKDEIQEEISRRFGYDLDRTLDEIRPHYQFDVSCQGSVPESIIAFLESSSYESAIRNAISLGGDGDTMACIAGGIAQAYYQHIPTAIIRGAAQRLPEPLLQIVEAFEDYCL